MYVCVFYFVCKLITFLNFFKMNLFLLAYNCFTVLCWFLLDNKVNHLCLYIYPLLPIPHPTHIYHHSTPSWAPCAIKQVPTFYLFCRWQCLYVSPNLEFIPLPHPLPQVHSLCLFVPITPLLFFIVFIICSYNCLFTLLYPPWTQFSNWMQKQFPNWDKA